MVHFSKVNNSRVDLQIKQEKVKKVLMEILETQKLHEKT